jgi:hypothetical protein
MDHAPVLKHPQPANALEAYFGETLAEAPKFTTPVPAMLTIFNGPLMIAGIIITLFSVLYFTHNLCIVHCPCSHQKNKKSISTF